VLAHLTEWIKIQMKIRQSITQQSVQISVLMLMNASSKDADEFMSDLKPMHKYLERDEEYLRSAPAIKIAVLDTGVDIKHPFISEAINRSRRIVCVQSFVDDNSKVDMVGHGSHIANLLLIVAPKAEIYIAKVSMDTNIPSGHKIAEVISLCRLPWKMGR
jgi:subtilisin family serine protease